MGPADLQRYKKLLLEKRRELSSAQDDTRARVPAVRGLQGDLKDEANAEAELQIRLHRTDGRLSRAIEEALWDEPWMISATKDCDLCNRWFCQAHFGIRTGIPAQRKGNPE